MSIFISIAAYRDPELIPTIRDCVAKARHPQDLRFGVCWQHGPDEEALSLPEGTRCSLIDVDWRESRGACWARAEIMRLWDGEDYFMQLDSHHRFVADWDVKLVEQMRLTGSTKPILTTYATPFTPGKIEVLTEAATQMDFHFFTPQAIAMFRPSNIPNWQQLHRPLRARFISAHFLFTIGDFVKEVPYDPELYFGGEEISLTIRAFTHGYDLFHPSEPILWHEYTRSYRTKHWDDHRKENGVEVEWHERDVTSVGKVQQFLAAPAIGPFACGTVRSFDEYEAYAGLSFRHRRIQDYTREHKEPPNPPLPSDWAEKVRTWRVIATIDRSALPEAALKDPQFWFVGAHDAGGKEIYREDAHGEELKRLLSGEGPQIIIERQFESAVEPAYWTVWPCSHSAGWLNKIEGRVELPTREAKPMSRRRRLSRRLRAAIRAPLGLASSTADAVLQRVARRFSRNGYAA